MNPTQPTTVLFAGYAPVHFVCFQPIFRILERSPDFEVVLSGGLKQVTGEVVQYDLEGLYQPFGLAPERLVPVEQLEQRHFDVVFGAQTKMICPGEAGCRVQIFHGISFRNRAIRPENMGCDYYFLVGPYMHRKFVEAGLLQANDPRALKVGFPKTDRLINGELDRSELLAKYGFDGTRPLVLYAPTGQKGNSLETMGEAVIEKLVQSGKYDILVKLHDHPKKAIDWPDRLERFDGPHFKLARDPDVIPLLFLADLLITDASSVSSEYSLLDRPMVFLDVPKLIAKAKVKSTSQLDLDTWGRCGGPLAESPGEALELVGRELSAPARFAPARQSMAKDLFYNPGGATRAATDWVMRHFGAPRLKNSA